MRRWLALSWALLCCGCGQNLASAGAWRLAATSPIVLSSPQLVNLSGGRVLSLSSYDQRTGAPVSHPYLYDPSRDRWSELGAMPEPRQAATALPLGGDRFLVAGGSAGPATGSAPLRSAWLYDADRDAWTRLRDMDAEQDGVAAVRLTDGKALVTGSLGHTETFDPAARTWTVLPPMPAPRPLFGLAPLPDGRALAIGGCNPASEHGAPAAMSRVDEFTGHGWRRVEDLPVAACPATAFPMSGGRIVVAAAQGQAPMLFDSGRWSVLPAPPVLSGPLGATSLLLPGDRLLQLMSLQQGNSVLLGGEVLDLASRTWTAVTTASYAGPNVGLGVSAATGPGDTVVVLASTITAHYLADAPPPAANVLDSPGWTAILVGVVLGLGLAVGVARARVGG